MQDPLFNSNIDNRTGYKTNSILCVPICNYEGEVIGVAQIINKTDGSDAFTDHDIQVVHLYRCCNYRVRVGYVRTLIVGTYGVKTNFRRYSSDI